jgi:hypothetical protein
MAQSWPLSQNLNKTSGVCGVCRAVRQIHLKDGTIHLHGPRKTPCAGSRKPPLSNIQSSHNSSCSISSTATPYCLKADKVSESSNLNCTNVSFSDTVLSAKCRVLKFIPKASRILAADKLASILQLICNNPDDISSWRDLLLFGNNCFRIPKIRRQGSQHKSLASKVNDILADFPKNVVTEAVHSKYNSSHLRNSVTKNCEKNDASKLAARVSSKIEEGDICGAIRLAVSDDVLASPDDNTVASLRLLHPARSSSMSSFRPISTDLPVFNSVNSDNGPLILSKEDIEKAIRSFPAGSSGGFDGLRPQHLKDLTSASARTAGQHLLTTLVSFANICLAGRVPLEVRPVFFGASLCALNKKGGGVRPIAVGCTLRRLIAKAACYNVKNKALNKLTLHQLGFGTPLGGEATVHAARCYVEHLSIGKAILKLDFSNAFNSISRNVLLSYVKEEFPEIFAFVNSCYGSESNLYFADQIITSAEGVQQGDPLGPLLFCLTISPLVLKLQSEFNVWYMDDGTLGDEIDILLSDFRTIINEGPNYGLHLNEIKCELITNDDSIVEKFRKLAPKVIHVKPSDAQILGAPIGTNIGVSLENKLHSLQQLFKRLMLLESHDAFFLLKNCFSIPKLSYILRCAPCYSNGELLRFDDFIRNTLQSLINVSLSDTAWDQASLPVSFGGLGIRKASDVALPAYISSTIASHDLVINLLPNQLHSMVGTKTESFLSAIRVWENKTNSNACDTSYSPRQKSWDKALMAVAKDRLLNDACDTLEKARLLAATSVNSGAFLNARPCSSIGTRLDNSTLRIAIGLRLGAPLCAPHICVCGQYVDCRGTHGLSCRQAAGRLSRHNSVNSLIKRALASAEIPSRLEPTALERNDGKRPDGMSLVPWKEGRCLVWDFTCPDTLATSHRNVAISGQGKVARNAEEKKRSKYSKLLATHFFIPIAVESLGALGDEALIFFREIGSRIAVTSGEPRSFMYLMQQLSVAIQRGNAACVLGTLDSTQEQAFPSSFLPTNELNEIASMVKTDLLL